VGSPINSVVILGAGALGSLYGAWMARAGLNVTLVAREPHAKAIQDNGLQVLSSGQSVSVPIRAVSDPRLVGDVDLLVLACKSFDTKEILDSWPGHPAFAFSIQNGIGQSSELVNRYGGSAVGAVSMVGATMEDPGEIQYTFGGVTYLGDLPTSTPNSAETMVEALSPGLDVLAIPDIRSVQWSKAVLAVAAMGVVGLTRQRYHRVFLEPGSREVFLELVREAALVAVADGAEVVDLPGPLGVASLLSLADEEATMRLEAIGREMVESGATNVRVSILQAIDRRRPIEIDAVFADVISVARLHDVNVPFIENVTRLLTAVDSAMRDGAR
jgi:2-dehydropantoate 2-reductase